MGMRKNPKQAQLNEIRGFLGEHVNTSKYSFQNMGHDDVRVRTPFVLNDGSVVDIFVMKYGDEYTVTDYGDTLHIVELHMPNGMRLDQRNLIGEICMSYYIDWVNYQVLEVYGVGKEFVGQTILNMAKCAVELSKIGTNEEKNIVRGSEQKWT